MLTLKKVWLTKYDENSDLYSLTLESIGPEKNSGKKICVTENTFPANPTPEHPKRHVIVISLFDTDDLIILRNNIDNILHTNEVEIMNMAIKMENMNSVLNKEKSK